MLSLRSLLPLLPYILLSACVVVKIYKAVLLPFTRITKFAIEMDNIVDCTQRLMRSTIAFVSVIPTIAFALHWAMMRG